MKEELNTGSNIKMVREANLRRLELIVYAAFYTGFLAATEQRTLTHEENSKEIKRLIGLIFKD
jgi:hypothetical protein